MVEVRSTLTSYNADDEEIKTALQVAIYGREKIDENTFYIIRTWLIYQPGQIHDAIRKRYSHFDQLHQSLESMGYPDLP